MSEEVENSVDIGFVEETEAWQLESRFFPSKVGGYPAWLDLSNLPMPSELECNRCKSPYIFLCQVYAPIETRDDCFHRTLFVFMCGNTQCCKNNDNSSFTVLRSQLERKNTFYPFDPPHESEIWHPEVKPEKWSDICVICGCRGPSQCGRCKKVRYCSKNHQIIHWKESHKEECGKGDGLSSAKVSLSCILPEFELLTESEGSVCKSETTTGIDSESDSEGEEEERIQDFEELHKEGKTGTLAGIESVDADLMRMAASEEDKVFAIFKRRISHNPEQVLRYNRGGVPLWISDQHVPSDQDIQPCLYCGSRRTFEFQILPQLLNHLSLDGVDQSVDWGVLAVFTCEKSCNEGPAYKTEFLWKQDIVT